MIEENNVLRVKYFDKTTYPDGLNFIGGKSDWIDLRASVNVTLKFGDFCCVPLGVAIQLPKGYEAILAPRSSLFKNYGVIQTNSIGIIDESFCGDNDQWSLPVLCLGKEITTIHKGDRLCQFRIIAHQPALRIEEVDFLGNPDRNGLGSTGVK